MCVETRKDKGVCALLFLFIYLFIYFFFFFFWGGGGVLLAICINTGLLDKREFLKPFCNVLSLSLFFFLLCTALTGRYSQDGRTRFKT